MAPSEPGTALLGVFCRNMFIVWIYCNGQYVETLLFSWFKAYRFNPERETLNPLPCEASPNSGSGHGVSSTTPNLGKLLVLLVVSSG